MDMNSDPDTPITDDGIWLSLMGGMQSVWDCGCHGPIF